MNHGHLGDAFDHWKGYFISRLGGTVRDLRAVPMFTDENCVRVWNGRAVAAYAGLLGISAADVLQSKVRFRNGDRAEYFDGVATVHGDLFVDPDTGISVRGDHKHVRPGDLATLLRPDRERVLVVYQHAYRSHGYVKAILDKTRDAIDDSRIGLFAYDGGAAAMVFASRSSTRLSAMRRQLERITRSRIVT